MKNLLRKLLAAVALFFCANVHATAGSTTQARAYESPVPPDQRRGAEQTFLTYPEWFLVHSPAELADYTGSNPVHGFPFASHVRQIWSSYADVTAEQIRQNYPRNIGYHVMILVIATSTSVEYGLRWAYENTIGRLSWATTDGKLSDEDRFAAIVAREYVDFIRRQPWYLFDFTSKLKALWTKTPMTGPNLIRKWERRYALTTELAIKAIYGKIIGLATRTAYEPARMTTYVVADRVPTPVPEGVQVVSTLTHGRALLALPRYYGFRIAATALADEGCDLLDIAGNRSVILVTAWEDEHNEHWLSRFRHLFEQPILTRPGRRRVALVLPVIDLSSFLRDARRHAVLVEHVYDY